MTTGGSALKAIARVRDEAHQLDVREDRKKLGEALVLPPWLEPNRTAMEADLPKLASLSGNS